MSSSHSELVLPSVTESSTVVELVSLLLEAKEFKEVERILKSHEEDMKMEMRNLERDYESVKKDRDLVERMQGLAERAKLKVEEELRNLKIECEGWKKEMIRLYEDQKVLCDRARRAEQRYQKAAEEFNKAEIEGKRRMLELSRKNEELTRALGKAEMEKSKMNEELKRALDEAEMVKSKMNEELKRALDEAEMEKSKMNEELKRALDEVEMERNKMIEELKGEFDEAEMERKRMIGKLMSEKQEARETAELHDQKLLESEARISHLEEAVASMLGVDVSGFRNRIYNHNTLVNGNGEVLIKANGNGEVLIPSTSHSTCSSVKTVRADLQKEGSGTLALMQTAVDATNQQHDAQISSALVSVHRGSEDEFHVRKQVVIEKSPQVVHASFLGSPNIIEVFESDDETPAPGRVCASNICASNANSSQKEVTYNKSGRSDCSVLTNGENVGDSIKDPLIDLQPKRKRSLTEIDAYDGSKILRQKINDCLLQVPSRKLSFEDIDISSDDSSTDSEDESSTDSYHFDNLVANLWKDREKRWMSAADMLSALKEDDELCMNALCALYRKKISAQKCVSNSSNSANLGFLHFDAMRGNELAEFLINGNPEYKLKRTLSEVQQKNPEALQRCKDLAMQYHEKLFEIYLKKEDPLFPPRKRISYDNLLGGGGCCWPEVGGAKYLLWSSVPYPSCNFVLAPDDNPIDGR